MIVAPLRTGFARHRAARRWHRPHPKVLVSKDSSATRCSHRGSAIVPALPRIIDAAPGALEARGKAQMDGMLKDGGGKQGIQDLHQGVTTASKGAINLTTKGAPPLQGFGIHVLSMPTRVFLVYSCLFLFASFLLLVKWQVKDSPVLVGTIGSASVGISCDTTSVYHGVSPYCIVLRYYSSRTVHAGEHFCCEQASRYRPIDWRQGT